MANPLKELPLSIQAFQLIQEIAINATPKKTWAALTHPDGWFFFPEMGSTKSELELKPGGLWIMKLPDGSQGFMGQVTCVETEKLLRVCGPFGMTHLPLTNVMIYELQPKDDGKTTLLRVGQRCFGYMDPDLQSRVTGGWKHLLGNIKALAEK